MTLILTHVAPSSSNDFLVTPGKIVPPRGGVTISGSIIIKQNYVMITCIRNSNSTITSFFVDPVDKYIHCTNFSKLEKTNNINCNQLKVKSYNYI